MAIWRLPPSLKWLIVSCLLWSAGSGLFYYALPVYAADLGAGPTQVGVLYASGFLAATLFLLPSGWLTDRFERGSVMLWGWLMGALSGPVYLMADRWEWLILGEVLGWGSTFCLPALQAYTLDADTSGRKTYTLSIVSASFAMGMLFAPWLGGVIAAHWSPHHVFVLTTLLYLASTLALYGMERQWPAGRARAAGAPSRLGPADLRAALLGWTTASPAVRRAALLIQPGELLLALTMALGQVYVAEVTGAGYGRIGWLGSLAAAGAVLLGPGLGWAADRHSYRRGLQAAGLMLAAYAALLLAAPAAGAAVAAAFLLRGAMEGTRALRSAAVAAYAAPGEMGRALSLAGIASGICATAGSYLGGWLYQFNRTWPLRLTLAGGAVYLVILQAVRRPPEAANEHPAAS